MKKIKFLILFLTSALFVCSLFAFTACFSSEDNSNDSSSDQLMQVGLYFNTLDVYGNSVYGKVSNVTTTFNFNNEITTEKDSEYVISVDEYGIQTSLTRIVPLSEGDNLFYLFEIVNNQVKSTYNITIRRRPIYTISFNTNGGTNVDSQTVEEDSYVTNPKTNPTRAGFDFAGWDYDFSTPITEEKQINAKWKLVSYAIEGDYVYFGEYPQTIKANDVTITETTNEKGYYLGSDGEWYAKVKEKPYSGNYIYSNNQSVSYGSESYFKVEPLKWQILSRSGDTISVVCESIISSMNFDVNLNNYKNSKIRKWLNNEFYNAAFSDLQKELIVTTEVDNSLESTCYSSNDYICENTYDNVYLLSLREAYFMDRTWNDSQSRQRMATDYAKAMGVWLGVDTYIGYGWWWLRSPCAALDRGAVVVGPSGTLEYYSYIYRGDHGVVPALQLMAK